MLNNPPGQSDPHAFAAWIAKRVELLAERDPCPTKVT